jgi:predicted nucleic acid-binding protein
LQLFIDGDPRWQLNVSTALVLEYEAVLKRERHRQGKEVSLVDTFLDDLVARANRRSIFFLLRPYLRDANDEFVLELAFASAIDYIITYNIKNFTQAKQIGIEVVTTPHEFLHILGDIV